MFLFINANAQEKKVVETRGQKVEATRGADPNIKTPKPANDENIVPKPADTEYRSGECKIWIDNNTGYSIDIYVDGNYKGTIAAWETKHTWAISGRTKLYGKSIGGTTSWGPIYFDCGDIYTWHLHN